MKSEDFCLEKKLKIEYIHPDFKELLMEGYEKHKDNAKLHKKKAALKKTKNSLKYGRNKKKLEN